VRRSASAQHSSHQGRTPDGFEQAAGLLQDEDGGAAAETGRAAELSRDELEGLGESATLPLPNADAMIENAVGVLGLPVGIGLNFLINGEDVLVPWRGGTVGDRGGVAGREDRAEGAGSLPTPTSRG